MTKFVCGDLHFAHKRIIEFTNNDGGRIRPFDSVLEHDETLIYNWNSVVKQNDTVYVCGDIAINKKGLPLIERLNGKKKLIIGNHDIWGYIELSKYFYDIVAYRTNYDPKFIMSHIPIHTSELDRFGVNVHAHTHANIVEVNGIPDQRYICVSMEQINFTPLSFDELIPMVKERQ